VSKRSFQIEGVREELRAALLVVPRTRGQLEGFELNGHSDSKFSRSPYREITNENGDEVIERVKAEVVRTIACRTFKRSPTPLNFNAFEHSRIVRDMNSTSQHISDWMKFAYGDEVVAPSKELLLSVLDEFYREQPTKLAKKTTKLLEQLAHLACWEKLNEINGKKLLTQTYIAQISGKKQSEWEKRWAKRWKLLLAILTQFDQEGLEHVHESGRSRKATRRNANMPVQSALQSGTGDNLASRMGLQQ
jgi:hypothetical protein